MTLSQIKSACSWQTLLRWFDSYAVDDIPIDSDDRRIDWLRTIPFIAMHIATLTVFFVGWSPIAVITALVLFAVRMFAITGFYHRYFSHRAFRTSRVVQFVFGAIGASSIQRGPLWWAAHHRIHHANSDKPHDTHSPLQKGFVWSHMGWFLSRQNFPTRLSRIQDFARYPELRFLDRFDVVVPTLFGVSLYLFGEWLADVRPDLMTNGWQMLVWGFVISTVVLYHITFTINSLAHGLGGRRYATPDDSRNNFILALLTFGEGWHNNHHFYPSSARQGFRWWELDLTYYVLRGFQMLGLVWDLRPVPAWVKEPRDLSRPDQATVREGISP